MDEPPHPHDKNITDLWTPIQLPLPNLTRGQYLLFARDAFSNQLYCDAMRFLMHSSMELEHSMDVEEERHIFFWSYITWAKRKLRTWRNFLISERELSHQAADQLNFVQLNALEQRIHQRMSYARGFIRFTQIMSQFVTLTLLADYCDTHLATMYFNIIMAIIIWHRSVVLEDMAGDDLVHGYEQTPMGALAYQRFLYLQTIQMHPILSETVMFGYAYSVFMKSKLRDKNMAHTYVRGVIDEIAANLDPAHILEIRGRFIYEILVNLERRWRPIAEHKVANPFIQHNPPQDLQR